MTNETTGLNTELNELERGLAQNQGAIDGLLSELRSQAKAQPTNQQLLERVNRDIDAHQERVERDSAEAQRRWKERRSQKPHRYPLSALIVTGTLCFLVGAITTAIAVLVSGG